MKLYWLQVRLNGGTNEINREVEQKKLGELNGGKTIRPRTINPKKKVKKT